MRAAVLSLVLLAAGCGSPSYKLVMGPKPEPYLSRSVFVPALSERLPKRVLVVHPRWTGSSLDRNRSAVERGLMTRGVHVRFAHPAQGPVLFGDEALELAGKAQADAVLEVTSLEPSQEHVSRYLVWNAKERRFVDADQTTYFAAHPLQRYEVQRGTFVLTARLLDLNGEKLASYHLTLPAANVPQGVYTATLVAGTLTQGDAPEEPILTASGGNEADAWGPTCGNAAMELLLEALGGELPGKPAPAPGSGAPVVAEQPEPEPKDPLAPAGEPKPAR